MVAILSTIGPSMSFFIQILSQFMIKCQQNLESCHFYKLSNVEIGVEYDTLTIITCGLAGSWFCLRRNVIQANGRLVFEDDLRSGLQGFTTQ